MVLAASLLALVLTCLPPSWQWVRSRGGELTGVGTGPAGTAGPALGRQQPVGEAVFDGQPPGGQPPGGQQPGGQQPGGQPLGGQAYGGQGLGGQG